MKQILKLIFLLVIGQTAFAQAPSNYTNINGRYRWIAGMFDSTFHIPKGTTPSLRTGGSTNGGALFYKTADSSLQLYTGTQWLRMLKVGDTTGMLTPYFNSVGVGLKNTGQTVYADTLLLSTRAWRQKGIDSVVALIPSLSGYVPYTGATQDLDMGTFSVNAKSFHIKGTAGQGHLGLKHQTATPSISANESGVYADVNGDLGLKNDNLYTSIFKTSLNTADRTYTFQNKSYTIGDSADIAARVKYTDTASMLSPYLRSNVASATYVPQTRTITINGTSQDLSANRTYNVGTVTSVATNTGTGITGGTITSSGTIAADTLLLSTRAWRQKGVDSVAALANTKVSSVSGTSPISSSGGTSPTISISQSSGSTNGFLSSTDWTTFNNKQNALTLTTTGTSGAATLVGSTLNIPQYQAALTNPVTGTGTTNYIPKFTSSSAIGNSVIYETSSNIGIGTTSPSGIGVVLNLYGGTNINSNLVLEGNSGNSFLSILSSATNGVPPSFMSKDGFRFAYASDKSATGYSEQMRLDASGNLGLGTSSPAVKLDIAQSSSGSTVELLRLQNTGVGANTSARLNFYAASTNYGSITGGYGSSSPELIFDINSANGIFRWRNNTTESMRLDASGNLGLGVTPSAWASFTGLQVGETGSFASNDFGSGNIQTFIGNNVYYDAVGFKYIQAGSARMLRMTSDNFNWEIAGSGSANGAISFTQAMTLFSTGNLAVGGTSDNGSRLNVTGAATFSSSVTAGSSILISNTINAYAYQNFGANSGYGWQIGKADNSTGLAPSNGFYFYDLTNSATRMVISQSGNVGIGTTSPTFAGGGGLQINTSGTDTRLHLTNTTTGITGIDGFELALVGNDIYYDSKESSGSQIFYTAGSERMRITSGGLVGIGSSSPDEILRINGTNSATSRLRIQNNGTNIAFLGSYSGIVGSGNANDLLLSTGGNDNLAFGINTTEKMRITSGGELLINTTSDAGDYKLQVNGNTYFNGSATINATTGNNDLVFLATTRPSIFVNSTNIGLQIRTNGTGVLELNGDNSSTGDVNINNALIYVDASASSVGIGTNAPSAKLEVNGAIKTAAPSGGTAAAWKLGERVASSGVTFNDQQYIQLDIGGTLYYLATVDLPMPEAYPQATSGPSNNYKIAPVQVKTTRDAEIEKLRKEIEELKQLIKNK